MPVRRVCVHADRDGEPVAVDLSLPSAAAVGELLPAIVDLVGGRPGELTAARRWRLHTATGDALDESRSLLDNAIHDGDLLVLAEADAPVPGPVLAPAGAVTPAAAAPAPLPVAAAGACTVALAAVVLALGAGSAHAMIGAVVAAVGVCAAAAVTVTTGYGAAPTLSVVCLCCATGFLVVPSAPAAPNVLLAATAGLAAALTMLRLSGRTPSALVAVAALLLPVAAVTVVPMPVVTVGAVLSGAGLALLAAAPRVAVAVERHRDAATAHAVLDGLVLGSSAGTAAGAITVAAGDPVVGVGAVALTALFAALLLLRARTYVDVARRIALGAGAFGCAGACLWLVADQHPGYVAVACGAVLAVGLLSNRMTPVALPSRVVDRLEYVALAAVVPVACWVAGLYALAGGVHP